MKSSFSSYLSNFKIYNNTKFRRDKNANAERKIKCDHRITNNIDIKQKTRHSQSAFVIRWK